MSRSRSGKKARQAKAAATPPAKDWREGYQAALREFLLAKGAPMQMEERRYGFEIDPTPNYYGWTDFDALDHFKHYRSYRKHEGDPCVAFATAETTIIERHYQQFQGTDFSGSDSQSFLVMHPVHCACGQYKDIYWAYEGTMGEVILGVVNP